MKKTGAIEVVGDPARDARLEKIVTHTGLRTVNQLLGQVASVISHVPPRHFYRVLGAIEREIETVKTEGKR